MFLALRHLWRSVDIVKTNHFIKNTNFLIYFWSLWLSMLFQMVRRLQLGRTRTTHIGTTNHARSKITGRHAQLWPVSSRCGRTPTRWPVRVGCYFLNQSGCRVSYESEKEDIYFCLLFRSLCEVKSSSMFRFGFYCWHK